MKILLALALLSLNLNVMADTKIVNPNLELGLWVITVDNSGLVDAALANAPKDADTAQARAMIERFMPKPIAVDNCMTQEDFNDIKKNLGSGHDESAENNCETSVLESTAKKMVVLMECPELVSTITTDFINSKRYESTIVSKQANSGQQNETTIKSVAQWKASECSANTVETPSAANTANIDDTLLGREVEEQAQRQKGRVGSRVEQAENRAVDKGVDKAVNKIFGELFK